MSGLTNPMYMANVCDEKGRQKGRPRKSYADQIGGEFANKKKKMLMKQPQYGIKLALAFRPVSESSGGPLPPSSQSVLHQPTLPYITYPIQEAGNAFVAPLRLRIFMGSDDHLFSGVSHAR
ncbi:hypothetical protein EVAR_72549_1, partial [Eumeta japonica]